MITLILAGEVILDASDAVTATADGWATPDAVYPAAAGVTGIASVATLPDDFRPDLYVWQAGALVRLPDPPPPPPPMPDITRRQLRLALLHLGVTSDQVEAQIAAMPRTPIEREAAMIEWRDSLTYQRDHWLVGALGATLGMTEAQIDDAWMEAAKI